MALLRWSEENPERITIVPGHDLGVFTFFVHLIYQMANTKKISANKTV